MTGPTDPHQGFFALWSHFYESTPLLGPLLRQQQDHALDRLAPRRGERILDLGCGPGRALRALEALGCSAIGLDPSMEMARQARAAGPVARGSAPSLPLKTASLDGVLCTNSFHHYPEPLATLRELRRALRPGGRAVLVDPNLEHPAARLAIYGGEALLFGLGVHLHAPDEWRALCREAGFAAVEVERLAPPLLSRLLPLTAVSLCVVARA